MENQFMRLLFYVLVLTVLIGKPIIANVDSCFYKIELQLAPEKHSLEANINLTYYANKNHSDSLTFLLYKDLSIKSLTCNNLIKYTFDTEHSSPYQLDRKSVV